MKSWQKRVLAWLAFIDVEVGLTVLLVWTLNHG